MLTNAAQRAERYLPLEYKMPRDAIAERTARCRCTFRYVSNFKRHRAISLPQHAFLVVLCLQTAVNYQSKSDKY